ncbi:MAG: hypothetical protein U0R50_12540 [Gaiellales bacterium]
MIVRILLWRLGEDQAQLEEVRAAIEELEPLSPPSTWLSNDASESFGAVLYTDAGDDDGLPEQLAVVRTVVGREPDLYEEYDAFD